MIVVTVAPKNQRARRWISRWIPELAPGVFCGDIPSQGHARFLDRLDPAEITVWWAPGTPRRLTSVATSEWTTTPAGTRDKGVTTPTEILKDAGLI